MTRPALLLASSFVFLAALAGCDRHETPPPNVPPQPNAAPRAQALPPPPPVPGAPLVYYRFPFLGKWRVQRTHYGAPQADQTWALDLVPVGKVAKQGKGESRSNSDYPCYGVPVLADAPGVIVIAVDGIPENVPGGPKNGYDQHGNYVVIDHQNGEYSLMAHLIPGSLKVRPGTFVQAGQELGRCGNSGLSDFPHIHWQVMDNMNAFAARGVQPRFAPFTCNGKPSVDPPQGRDILENQ